MRDIQIYGRFGAQPIDESNHNVLDQTIDVLSKIQLNATAAIAELSKNIIKDTIDAINCNVAGIGKLVSRTIVDDFKQIMDKTCADVADLVKSIPSESAAHVAHTFPDGVEHMENYPTVIELLKKHHISGSPFNPLVWPKEFPQKDLYDLDENKIFEALQQRVAFIIDLTKICIGGSYDYKQILGRVWILSNGGAILFGFADEHSCRSLASPYSISNITYEVTASHGQKKYCFNSNKIMWSPISYESYCDGMVKLWTMWGYYADYLNDMDAYAKTISKLTLPTRLNSYLQSEVSVLNQLSQTIENINSQQNNILALEKQLAAQKVELSKLVSNC